MKDNVIYIPTCISATERTQFHKWNTDIVKFTILLKEDEFNGEVIDYCYSVKDLEILGSQGIEESIIWHFRFHRLLPIENDWDSFLHLIKSDFACDDYLAIRDIYYPKNMKLPQYCNLIEKSRKRKREEN